MRKLVSIETITSLHPIDGADRIELALVRGWRCVVPKGQYTEGDLVLFCEVDSVLPEDSRWEFLSADKWRVRTKRFRGQISQGLVLPVSDLTQAEYTLIMHHREDPAIVLGVQKYEPPVPMSADIIGEFPSLVPKTDQERIQNLGYALDIYKGRAFEITEKLDGQSLTVFYINGEFGVATRNNTVDHRMGNVYSKICENHHFERILPDMGRNVAIQGELIGTKMNGNRLGLKFNAYYVFDIYDVDLGRYLLPPERYTFLNQFNDFGKKLASDDKTFIYLQNAPLVQSPHVMSLGETVDTLIERFNGMKSHLVDDKLAEGVVFKSFEPNGNSYVPSSFKVISNAYLLKFE